MKLLFVVAEMSPLVKVGGLADIGGGLPIALRALGLDARVVLPYYAAIDGAAASATRVATLPNEAAIWQGEVGDVPVYLIEHAPSFSRANVYGYDDDLDRFLAFDDAILASSKSLHWRPDVLHLHDWHSGLLATRLAGGSQHPWADLPLICTIHNLGWRGPFDEAFAREHDLSQQALAAPADVEPTLPYSALAQGILHADLLSTVSPTYAREITTPELGWDFAPLLASRSDRLCGILHGSDREAHDPATDRHLTSPYDQERLDQRIENKRELQRRLGLPVEEETAVVAMVSRLYWQKGPDLAAAAVESLLATNRFQFVVLGQGDEENERPLLELAAHHPQRVVTRIAFDHPLGQLIYGGCDLFLMPSRYEPCGLGQLIAMRYGAVPVVRRTGGLADTVQPYDPACDDGTGFLFDEATPEATAAALQGALAVYRDRSAWRNLQLRGMAQDYSWERAAVQYAELYERALRIRTARPAGEAP